MGFNGYCALLFHIGALVKTSNGPIISKLSVSVSVSEINCYLAKFLKKELEKDERSLPI
jgi:uncharacterized membrane protein